MQGIDFIKDLAVVMLVAGLVGWACHRAGLSVIVGFLAAGMVIGPFTPPFSLVTDIGRIETLAQVGLVFLMFSIGMKLSLRKLRRLGLSLLVATAVTALIVYNLSRLGSPLLGFSGESAVFFGALLIVSSSAIISKVLQETGLTHEKAGQMAMGITVLEDVVAVISLALLNSVVLLGGMGEARVGQTLGLLSAFVALAGVIGLLLVPWLLRRLGESASEELQTLMVAGLMLGLALTAQKAGYSLAMGAFILGSIIAETPQRAQIDRVFEGARDMFSAVFFVSIGMQIDVRLLGQSWLLVLGASVLAMVARPLGGTVAMLVTGVQLKDAVRVGLMITPIGEFSFIIAQLGVTAGVVPASFGAVAVGLSLLTAIAAPVLTRRSGVISDWVAARQPVWLESWLGYYGRLLERFQQIQKRSVLWQLSRKRVIQITLEMLLVTGLFVFSDQMFSLVRDYLPVHSRYPSGATVLFWSVLVLVALAPLVAIWRNLSALSLLYAQVSTQGHAKAAKLAPVVETGLKIGAGLLLVLWLNAILPISGAARWLPAAVLVVVLVGLYFLRSRLIYWHSMLEVELQERLTQGDHKFTGTTAPWMAPHGEWKLALTDCMLPDLADSRGRSLGELALRTKFGCTVAGVERQGVMVGNPTGDMILYPRDKVLLLGTAEQVAAGKEYLQRASGAPVTSNFDEVRMESLEIPVESRLHGRTLAEVALGKAYGLQVAGINRAGHRILNPRGDEKLCVGDSLLVLGSPDQIATFKESLRV
ncbi:sodium:proton exchanger [Oleiharenicola lentus]|jgi:CPA2 family monovalent cation:H+ antiporter-2|uniref:Sodium:proton exchanger n=1 Tax=Oleiharenicola lentus TaxID=2508720 RepID=A0A4Q1CAT2_9BACT|nr:cation:proton antiporter [Oleiharenicola lentus]RXK56207.1 sodium:proton exchanger [Oleiharenicola lentus]